MVCNSFFYVWIVIYVFYVSTSSNDIHKVRVLINIDNSKKNLLGHVQKT